MAEDIKKVLTDLEQTVKAIAIKKNLDLPQEDSGLILVEREATLKKVNATDKPFPTDEEMGRINQYAYEPQKPEEWMVLRGVNCIGPGNAVDVQGDSFDKQAEKDLADQAPGTPILINHDHAIDRSAPPVGICLSAEMTPQGPRETWGIPLDDYNGPIVKGIKRGTVRSISVGMLVDPAHKVCSSCDKSVYSYACPHTPGQMDEEGKMVSSKIVRVARYLERSLVNVPARLFSNLGKPGSAKVFELEKLTPGASHYADPGFQEDKKPRYPLDTEEHIRAAHSYFGQARNRDKYTPEQQAHIKAKIHAAWQRVIDPAGPPSDSDSEKSIDSDVVIISPSIPTVVSIDLTKNNDAATIDKVLATIQDNTVAKAKTEDKEASKLSTGSGDADQSKYESVQAPTAANASKSDEDMADEKEADEDDECMKAKKEPDGDEGVGGDDMDGDSDTKNMDTEAGSEQKLPAVNRGKDPTANIPKALQVEASLSSESALTIKSLVAANKEALEKVNKLSDMVIEQSKAFAAVQSKQSEMIDQLAKLQGEICQAVKDAATTSADELVEKVLEIANQVVVTQETNKKVSVNQSGLDGFLMSQYGNRSGQ